jgi:hypothetical protein
MRRPQWVRSLWGKKECYESKRKRRHGETPCGERCFQIRPVARCLKKRTNEELFPHEQQNNDERLIRQANSGKMEKILKIILSGEREWRKLLFEKELGR